MENTIKKYKYNIIKNKNKSLYFLYVIFFESGDKYKNKIIPIY